MNILFYDTETTGLPNRNRPFSDPSQPYLTQLGFLYEEDGEPVHSLDTFVQPWGPDWLITPTAQALTGITREMCESGRPLEGVLDEFVDYAAMADVLVCHNSAFDSQLMMIQAARLDPGMEVKAIFEGSDHVCTMLAATPICKIRKKDGRVGNKWPKLIEAYKFFFDEEFDGAHNAMVDILATQRLFRHLCSIGAMDSSFSKIGMEAPRYG